MKEAEEIEEQLLDLRELRSNGTEINLKDYSETALNYYTRFSLIQRSNEEFKKAINQIIIQETEQHMN